MGSKQGEVELLLYFCTLIKDSGIPIEKNKVIDNIFNNQLKKLNAGIEAMHEDLQYEYRREVDRLIG